MPFGNTDFAFTFSDHQKREGFQYQTIAALTSSTCSPRVDFEHESAVFDDGFSRVSPQKQPRNLLWQDQFAFRERLFLTAGISSRHTKLVPEACERR